MAPFPENATGYNIPASPATHTVPKPTGLVAGELVVVYELLDSNAETMSAPADGSWTVVGPGAVNPVGDTADAQGYCWVHVATAGDVSGSGWTFTKSGTTRVGAGLIVRVSGVDASTPMFDHAGAGTALSATHATPQVDVDTDTLWLGFVGVDPSATGATWTWPGGTDELTQHENTTGFVTVSVAEEVFASPATNITRTATLGVVATDVGVSFAVALNPGVTTVDPAQNADVSLSVGEDFRWRAEIQETGGGTAITDGYQLRFSKNGGAYTQVTTGTDLRPVATAAFTDGAATTNLLTAGTGTFVAGEGDEVDAVTGSIALGAGGHTEIEFSLEIFSATVGDTFDLRVYKDDGTALDSYADTARITVISTVPTIGVTPTSLSFTASEGGPNPSNKIISLTNTGGGVLEWTTSDNAAWLAVTPASGTGAATLTAAVTLGALTQGVYNADITIADPDATNTPVTVPVTLTVGAPASFPVEVAGIYPETSNQCAPVLAPSGNLWLVNENGPTSADIEPAARESTDGGQTWTVRDVQTQDGDLESTSYLIVGTTLHYAYQRSGYIVYYNTFDLTTKTWTLRNQEIYAGSAAPFDQVCSIVVRSNGEVVCLYMSGNGVLSYKVRSTGGVWGSAVVLDGEAGKVFSQGYLKLSLQDNTVHIVYVNHTDGILYYRSLSPTDVLSARTQVATGLPAAANGSGYYKPLPDDALQVYDEGTTDWLYAAWKRQSDQRLAGAPITGAPGTPVVGTVEQISDHLIHQDPQGLGSFQAVAGMAIDPATQVLHACYGRSTNGLPSTNATGTFEMYHATRDPGTGWGTDVQEGGASGQPIAACAPSVNTVGGTKQLTIFFDEQTGVDPGISHYGRVVLAVPTQIPSLVMAPPIPA